MIQVLKTARAAGKPASHWFSPNRGDWTDKDYILALALTIYEDGLCSCGQPLVLAHHPDNDGWYDAVKSQCHACAARERATAASGTQPYQPQPGERISTRYTRPPDKPLPHH